MPNLRNSKDEGALFYFGSKDHTSLSSESEAKAYEILSYCSSHGSCTRHLAVKKISANRSIIVI